MTVIDQRCYNETYIAYILSALKLTLVLLNKMPHPLLIVSQSDCLVQIVDTNSHHDKKCRSRLIWIYTVGKGKVYPPSVGQELIKLPLKMFVRLSLLTMTNPNQLCDVLLFVCSKMTDETNLSSKLPVADRTREV